MRNLIIALFFVALGTTTFAQTAPVTSTPTPVQAEVSKNIFPNAAIKSAAPIMADMADEEMLFKAGVNNNDEEEEKSVSESTSTGYMDALKKIQPKFIPAQTTLLAVVTYGTITKEIV